jgi:hypothetical protein
MATTTTARLLCLSLLAMPAVLVAQANPVASAVRSLADPTGKHLLQAAEAMPATAYSFRPTKAQMSFAEIIVHVRGDNRLTCAALSGLAAPAESNPTPADGKAVLVAALSRSLDFCHSALAHFDDARVAEAATWYGHPTTRVMAALGLLADWSDHYSQLAMHLRLNGILPPTAR